ncbi:hypothetical protein KKB18_13900, partial [bacterium]|nr:hypothetical protein [bacterium]
TITSTPIRTVTSTEHITSTPIPTPHDSLPVLADGRVSPERGVKDATTFEYLVRYHDADGGRPNRADVFINDVEKRMTLKTDTLSDGLYHYYISGRELNVGNNQFYFYFVDDEGNSVRLPSADFFEGPWVDANPQTPTPHETSTDIPTPIVTITETPLPTATITETPIATITETAIPTFTPTPCRAVIFGLGLNADYAGEWEDTYVDEENPETNYGREENLYLKNTLKHRKYTHTRVNIGLLPDDSKILEAQLYFCVMGFESSGPFDIAAYGLEGTPGANWTQSSDTFNMYNNHLAIPNAYWTEREGGNKDKSLESYASNRWEPGTNWKYLEFNNSGLSYLEDRARSGICSFFIGILPDASGSDTFEHEVASSKNPDEVLRPYLRIVFCSDEAIGQSSTMKIASPEYFYYNTVLLSWTPIHEADHYQFDCMIRDQIHSFSLPDNWLRLVANNEEEWDYFVSLGSIAYRVTALDSLGNIVRGPTEIAYFTCYNQAVTQIPPKYSTILNQDLNPEHLDIANPPDFYYNTLLLSWTPIQNTHHYLLEYTFSNRLFKLEVTDNWLRLIFTNTQQWKNLVDVGPITYRVTAINSQYQEIGAPSDFSSFVCK